MNEESVGRFGGNFKFYFKIKKFFTLYSNFEEFAAENNINYLTLKKTIDSYNSSYKSLTTDQFNKKCFPVEFSLNSPIYSAIITPALHYSMGGLKINEFAEVID